MPGDSISKDEALIPQQTESNVERETDLEATLSLPERFEEYKRRNDITHNEAIVKVYKSQDVNKDTRLQLVAEYDEIPSETDIGKRFGGGRYKMVCHIPKLNGQSKRMGTSYSIVLGDNWDDEKYSNKNPESKGVGFSSAMVPVHQSTGVGVSDLIKLITAAAPIITAIIDRKPKPDDLSNMYQKMVNTNMEAMAKMQERVIEMTYERENLQMNEERNMSWLEMILPIVQDLLQKFFDKSGKSNVPGIGSIAKLNPQFQEIVNNPEKLDSLKKELVSQYGEDYTNNVLDQLGVKG